MLTFCGMGIETQNSLTMDRRTFIKNSSLTGVGLALGSAVMNCKESSSKEDTNMTATTNFPIAICTWGFVQANAKAGEALQNGSNALDSAILGVSVEEENLKNTTVGKGGAPDREGNVTLDACVMDSNGNCGAVVCVENITNVAKLAKEVMTETPHVMLAGEGAEAFAYERGFPKESLLYSH